MGGVMRRAFSPQMPFVLICPWPAMGRICIGPMALLIAVRRDADVKDPFGWHLIGRP